MLPQHMPDILNYTTRNRKNIFILHNNCDITHWLELIFLSACYVYGAVNNLFRAKIHICTPEHDYLFQRYRKN